MVAEKKRRPKFPKRAPVSPPGRRCITLHLGGETQIDSYRAAFAYRGKNAKELSKRFFARPEVRKMVDELTAKTERKAILSLNDRLKILAAGAQVPGDAPALIAARARSVKVYNETARDVAPDRLDVTATVKGDPAAPIVTTIIRPTVQQTIEAIKSARQASSSASPPAAPA